MANEYQLTLAGIAPVAQVAERALPDPADRPTGSAPMLSADLYDRYGFAVTVRAGRDRFIEVESDDGKWEWEAETYVSLTFRMDDDVDWGRQVLNMLAVVRRVLDTGSEDAVLVQNSDHLVFTRFDRVLVKHRREAWWKHYPGADDLIPG